MPSRTIGLPGTGSAAGRSARDSPVIGLTRIDRAGHQLRTSDRVLQELINEIRALSLAPGPVLSEVDLAQQLGVSRTPVREALARLADMGLVVVVPQVGTRVALIQLSEVEHARFMREHLEIAAFESAAQLSDVDTSLACRFLAEQRAAAAAGDLDQFFAAGFASSQGTPDGLCVDASGCLWIAMWGGGRIIVLAPSGEVISEIVLPVHQPSSCAFAGRSLDRLCITSAREGLGLADDDPAPDGSVLCIEGIGARGMHTAAFGG